MCDLHLNNENIINDELHVLFINHLKKVGIKHESMIAEGYVLIKQEDFIELSIESDPDANSKLDSKNIAVRYKYVGIRDDNNRQFCADVLDLDLIYRKEDIDMMSFRTENKEFGTYSIFKYKGSYGCRHKWQRLLYEKKDGEVTYNERSGSGTPKNVNDSFATRVNPKPVHLNYEKILQLKDMVLAQIKFKKNGSITRTSLVKRPAVEVDFLKLAEDQNYIKLALNDEKQNVTGPALIPNKNYLRGREFFINTLGIDSSGYIFFDEETVKLFAAEFLKNGNSINLEHEIEVNKDDISLVESWIIETKHDKAYDMGFTKDQCPVGTWMMTQHVNNEALWKEIKDGNYNGYSIEGSPDIVLISSSIQLSESTKEDVIADDIVKIIMNEIEENMKIKNNK